MVNRLWKIVHINQTRDIVSDVILVLFVPKKSIILTCDCLSNGIEAVLACLFEDDSEKPISFASKSLSKAELNLLHDSIGPSVCYK